MHLMAKQSAARRLRPLPAEPEPAPLWRLCAEQLGRPVSSEAELLYFVTHAPLSMPVVLKLSTHW